MVTVVYKLKEAPSQLLKTFPLQKRREAASSPVRHFIASLEQWLDWLASEMGMVELMVAVYHKIQVDFRLFAHLSVARLHRCVRFEILKHGFCTTTSLQWLAT